MNRRHDMTTYMDPEERAYDRPLWMSPRRGIARLPNGKLGRVRLGIPDTFFTIPAIARIDGRLMRGHVSARDLGDASEIYFTVARRYNHPSNPCTCDAGGRSPCDWKGCPARLNTTKESAD